MQIALLPLLMVLMVAGCKKDENKVFFEGGTAPALSASATNVPLSPDRNSETAIIFNWTNPNFRFTTGISSHNVEYALEMDRNSSFNSPNMREITLTSDLSRRFTVLELNSFLGNVMELPLDANVQVFVRVVAFLRAEGVTTRVGALTSNVVSFNTRPYAPPPLVEPPTDGTLWATGDAFAAPDWQNPLLPPFVNDQAFRRVTNTLYEAELNFTRPGAFKLIQTNGVWGTQYHRVDGDAFGGTFRKRDADPAFLGPADPGRYRMTVNFQTGRFTLVKL